MARFLCQSCSTEQGSWSGVCSKCGSSRAIQLEAEDTMVGRRIAGKYKILRKLGQGGMGAVYEAEVEGIGQRVALKFLSNAFQMDSKTAFRFLNEAKGLARLSHPNAVKLMDFAQDEEGRLFFSMEYVEGVDLKKFITEQGRVSPRDALQLTVQVADALAHAHGKGVIHRDLKPENIMVRKWAGGLFVTVLDFGLARLVEEGASRLTNTGTLMGSPRYMSPEQAFGKEVDHRTDIYSLGIVLFEMVTGTQPFVAEGHMEILQKQREMPMPHLWEVANNLDLPEIDAVIQRATAKASQDRFTSMEELSAPLEQISATLGRAPQTRSPLLDQRHSEPSIPGLPGVQKTPYPLASPVPAPSVPEPSRAPQQPQPSHASQASFSQRGSGAWADRPPEGIAAGASLAPGPSLSGVVPPRRRIPWLILGSVGGLIAVAAAILVVSRRPSVPKPTPARSEEAAPPPKQPRSLEAAMPLPPPPTTAPVVPPPAAAPTHASAPNAVAPAPPAVAAQEVPAAPPPPKTRRTAGKSKKSQNSDKKSALVDPFAE